MFGFMDTPPFLPPQASKFAVEYDLLFWYISAVCAFGGAVVYALLVYCCFRFAKSPTNTTPQRILGSTKLEVIWSVIPLLFFLSFFVWGARLYDIAINPPKDAQEFEYFVVGKQWMWKVQGPQGHRQINEITLPCPDENDTTPVKVKVTGTSEDVIHDFGIPAFRSKFDVVPGRYTTAWYEPTKPGTYYLFCDQYCGQGHSQMVGKVHVLRKSDYAKWLDGELRTRDGKHPVDGSPAWQGRLLFHKLQCNGCHNKEESAKAPNLEMMYGTYRQLTGGKSVKADETYIRNAIRNPTMHVREGWKPIMLAYPPSLATEDDIICLTAYIKSLKPGDLPTRNELTPAPLGAAIRDTQAPPEPPKPPVDPNAPKPPAGLQGGNK